MDLAARKPQTAIQFDLKGSVAADRQTKLGTRGGQYRDCDDERRHHWCRRAGRVCVCGELVPKVYRRRRGPIVHAIPTPYGYQLREHLSQPVVAQHPNTQDDAAKELGGHIPIQFVLAIVAPAQCFKNGAISPEDFPTPTRHTLLSCSWHPPRLRPLATLGAVLPMHLELCKSAKERPALRIACTADDTYLCGPPSTLYTDFQFVRDKLYNNCDLLTNTEKLKAFCPVGGVEGIPADILDEQGGEIFGFKCVGGYVGSACRIILANSETGMHR